MNYKTATLFATLLLAVACTSKQPPLVDTYWGADEIMGKAINRSLGGDPDTFDLIFFEDRFASKGDCNQIMGQYVANAEDGTITVKPAGTTMMFCPDIQTEERYVKALEQVNRYKMRGNTLTMYRDDELLIVFHKRDKEVKEE